MRPAAPFVLSFAPTDDGCALLLDPGNAPGAATESIRLHVRGVEGPLGALCDWVSEFLEGRLSSPWTGDERLPLWLREQSEDVCRVEVVPQGTDIVAWQATSSRWEITRAFWRALRKLETTVRPAEFLATWREPFPTEPMARFSARVRAWHLRSHELGHHH